ncbi:MAG: hypothetical protein PHV32_06120 [Eubacteriales bacterium]|nr:hypothetical protein [Eubacteriales bacterium]
MANKDNRTNIKDERIEDVTLYGEFISSYHNWTTSEKQRRKGRWLAEISEEVSPDKKQGEQVGKKPGQ